MAKRLQYYIGGGYGQKITILHRGGYGQKITILHREGGVYRDPQKWLRNLWMTPKSGEVYIELAGHQKRDIVLRLVWRGEFLGDLTKRDIALGEVRRRGSFDLTPGNCHDLPSESSPRWALVKNGKLYWNCENIPLSPSSTYISHSHIWDFPMKRLLT